MVKTKKGQLTIFVIIALLIIVSLAVIFYANPLKISETASIRQNPQGFIQDCARKAATPAVDSIVPNGGILNPAEGKYITWNGAKAIWMCYAAEKEQVCTAQHPMLRAEIEKQISDIIKPQIEKCFSQVKNEFQSYEYTENPLNLALEISAGKLYIKIDKKISYVKNSVTTMLQNFNTQIPSPLYDFVIISNDIVNEETKCNCADNNCNADIMALNRDRRDYQTKREVNSFNTKIYTLTELSSKKDFSFAVRNCVRLPY